MALLKNTLLDYESSKNKGRMMHLVILATLPGLFVLVLFFGWGSLINITITSVAALGFEAAVVKLRKRPVMFYLRDNSALLTAILLGLSLPPLAPWWIPVVGSFFAIVIAKNLYGSNGYNPFNPAMVGYAVLLISFPIQMTSWPAPIYMYPEIIQIPGLFQSIQVVFPIFSPDNFLSLSKSTISIVDAFTAATPLEVFKQNTGLLVDQVYKDTPLFKQGILAGYGWEWINISFLLGGCFLLYRGIFTWHAPFGMLGSLVLCSSIFYDGGSSSSLGSPLFHLFSGATMLGAFFIITDPVTSASNSKGRLIYGILIGVLIFIIRSWGSFPDAVAFAVLIMNFSAPLIDHLTIEHNNQYSKSSKSQKKGSSDAR